MDIEKVICYLKTSLMVGIEDKEGRVNSLVDRGCLMVALAELERRIPPEVVEEKITELNEEYALNNATGAFGNDYYIESEKYAFAEEKLKELLNKE